MDLYRDLFCMEIFYYIEAMYMLLIDKSIVIYIRFKEIIYKEIRNN